MSTDPADLNLEKLLDAKCEGDKPELLRLAADLLVEIPKQDVDSLCELIASVLTDAYRMGLDGGASVMTAQMEHVVKGRLG